MPCASFSMLDGPGGTGCDVPVLSWVSRDVIVAAVYDCETWSLALREECRLRAFQNKIPRLIFEPKRDENGEWKKLHIVRVIKSRSLKWAE